ncbi:MAG: class I SAM-dependent methyltransferase [Oscillospiraceae bacterium]|nr:class I SAM-dependent methyltransferase [Oscillospiraceae bacterium]
MTGYAALASVYDDFTANVGYEALARRVDAVFKENKVKGIVLDAGCGTGTLALLLSKCGYDMIGVDASEEMLAAARTKIGGAPVTLLCQRLEELDLFGTVRGIVCTLDTLNHIPSARALDEIFRRFGLFCEPGGILVFDANTPYKHEKVLADNAFVFERPGGLCVWRNEYQAAKHRVRMTADVFSGAGSGPYERRTDCFYEYDREPALFGRLLEKHGFRLLSMLDGDTSAPPTPQTQRIFVTARRNDWEPPAADEGK